MMKRRCYITAVNNRYGSNEFLPYAAGLMWSHARMQPEIADAWEVPPGGLLYRKEAIDRALARIDRPAVVAFSSYIWNWRWNCALAKAVKARWPSCVTVAGGVQIPDPDLDASVDLAAWFAEHPYFDVAARGEGERTFAGVLRALALGDASGALDHVGGLAFRRDGAVVVTPRRDEVPLDAIPSPYLAGLFDDILADGAGDRFQVLQETNRGCPYSCTFCAWGAGTLSKLRPFDAERIIAEYEWFGRNAIAYLYNCDANYGILKRDVDLTEALIRTRERFGYPRQFRAAFAKNSNDVVFNISLRLQRAGMLKATTLALQSTDDGVLVHIKRKNIKQTRLAALARQYEAAGIPTYTELIVGLPGETWDTFLDGIDAVLDAELHDGLSIYLCMLLENTELASRASRTRYEIESVPMRALLYHGTPDLDPSVPDEIQETVVGTRDMPRVYLRRAVLYAWVVQAFHALGLTQDTARALRRQMSYRTFYERLLAWLEAHPTTVGGRALARAATLWDGAVQGQSWTAVDARFGEISWPPEEWLFLHAVVEHARLYDELAAFYCDVAGDKGPGLLQAQRQRVVDPSGLGLDLKTYAQEAVWYGRKGPGAALRVRPVPSAAAGAAPAAAGADTEAGAGAGT